MDRDLPKGATKSEVSCSLLTDMWDPPTLAATPGLELVRHYANYVRHALASLTNDLGIRIPSHDYQLAREQIPLHNQAELETLAAKIQEAWVNRGEFGTRKHDLGLAVLR